MPFGFGKKLTKRFSRKRTQSRSPGEEHVEGPSGSVSSRPTTSQEEFLSTFGGDNDDNDDLSRPRVIEAAQEMRRRSQAGQKSEVLQELQSEIEEFVQRVVNIRLNRQQQEPDEPFEDAIDQPSTTSSSSYHMQEEESEEDGRKSRLSGRRDKGSYGMTTTQDSRWSYSRESVSRGEKRGHSGKTSEGMRRAYSTASMSRRHRRDSTGGVTRPSSRHGGEGTGAYDIKGEYSRSSMPSRYARRHETEGMEGTHGFGGAYRRLSMPSRLGHESYDERSQETSGVYGRGAYSEASTSSKQKKRTGSSVVEGPSRMERTPRSEGRGTYRRPTVRRRLAQDFEFEEHVTQRPSASRRQAQDYEYELPLEEQSASRSPSTGSSQDSEPHELSFEEQGTHDAGKEKRSSSMSRRAQDYETYKVPTEEQGGTYEGAYRRPMKRHTQDYEPYEFPSEEHRGVRDVGAYRRSSRRSHDYETHVVSSEEQEEYRRTGRQVQEYEPHIERTYRSPRQDYELPFEERGGNYRRPRMASRQTQYYEPHDLTYEEMSPRRFGSRFGMASEHVQQRISSPRLIEHDADLGGCLCATCVRLREALQQRLFDVKEYKENIGESLLEFMRPHIYPSSRVCSSCGEERQAHSQFAHVCQKTARKYSPYGRDTVLEGRPPMTTRTEQGNESEIEKVKTNIQEGLIQLDKFMQRHYSRESGDKYETQTSRTSEGQVTLSPSGSGGRASMVSQSVQTVEMTDADEFSSQKRESEQEIQESHQAFPRMESSTDLLSQGVQTQETGLQHLFMQHELRRRQFEEAQRVDDTVTGMGSGVQTMGADSQNLLRREHEQERRGSCTQTVHQRDSHIREEETPERSLGICGSRSESSTVNVPEQKRQMLQTESEDSSEDDGENIEEVTPTVRSTARLESVSYTSLSGRQWSETSVAYVRVTPSQSSGSSVYEDAVASLSRPLIDIDSQGRRRFPDNRGPDYLNIAERLSNINELLLQVQRDTQELRDNQGQRQPDNEELRVIVKKREHFSSSDSSTNEYEDTSETDHGFGIGQAKGKPQSWKSRSESGTEICIAKGSKLAKHTGERGQQQQPATSPIIMRRTLSDSQTRPSQQFPVKQRPYVNPALSKRSECQPAKTDIRLEAGPSQHQAQKLARQTSKTQKSERSFTQTIKKPPQGRQMASRSDRPVEHAADTRLQPRQTIGTGEKVKKPSKLQELLKEHGASVSQRSASRDDIFGLLSGMFVPPQIEMSTQFSTRQQTRPAIPESLCQTPEETRRKSDHSTRSLEMSTHSEFRRTLDKPSSTKGHQSSQESSGFSKILDEPADTQSNTRSDFMRTIEQMIQQAPDTSGQGSQSVQSEFRRPLEYAASTSAQRSLVQESVRQPVFESRSASEGGRSYEFRKSHDHTVSTSAQSSVEESVRQPQLEDRSAGKGSRSDAMSMLMKHFMSAGPGRGMPPMPLGRGSTPSSGTPASTDIREHAYVRTSGGQIGASRQELPHPRASVEVTRSESREDKVIEKTTSAQAEISRPGIATEQKKQQPKSSKDGENVETSRPERYKQPTYSQREDVPQMETTRHTVQPALTHSKPDIVIPKETYNLVKIGSKPQPIKRVSSESKLIEGVHAEESLRPQAAPDARSETSGASVSQQESVKTGCEKTPSLSSVVVEQSMEANRETVQSVSLQKINFSEPPSEGTQAEILPRRTAEERILKSPEKVKQPESSGISVSESQQDLRKKPLPMKVPSRCDLQLAKRVGSGEIPSPHGDTSPKKVLGGASSSADTKEKSDLRTSESRHIAAQATVVKHSKSVDSGASSVKEDPHMRNIHERKELTSSKPSKQVRPGTPMPKISEPEMCRNVQAQSGDFSIDPNDENFNQTEYLKEVYRLMEKKRKFKVMPTIEECQEPTTEERFYGYIFSNTVSHVERIYASRDFRVTPLRSGTTSSSCKVQKPGGKSPEKEKVVQKQSSNTEIQTTAEDKPEEVAFSVTVKEYVPTKGSRLPQFGAFAVGRGRPKPKGTPKKQAPIQKEKKEDSEKDKDIEKKT